MKSTHQEGRIQLAVAALDAFRAEYQRLSSTWEQLDVKAQGTAATAGVFLGGMFLFVTQNQPTSAASRVLLGSAVVALMIGMFCSLLAAMIREASDGPSGSMVKQLTEDLLQIEEDDELQTRIPDFFSEQSALWDSATQEVSRINTIKAKWLTGAQVALTIAIGLVAILTLSAMIER